MIQQNQLSTLFVLPEFSTPSNYEPGGREFESANFSYRDNVLPRFTSPTRRRNQVVAGELWDSLSQIFSAAAIRLVSSAAE